MTPRMEDASSIAAPEELGADRGTVRVWAEVQEWTVRV